MPGLLEDIVGFMMEGLRKTGESAGKANEARSQAVEAIRSGKKVDLGPLLQEAIGVSQPMAGMITPSAWKLMQPEAKSMLTNIADQFPDFFNKVLKSPTQLFASVPKNLPSGALGQLGTQKLAKDLAEKTGQPHMADNPISAIMSVINSEAPKTSTGVHELQHMLNFPRVQKTDPADAATIGTLLSEILPARGQSSLNMRMAQRSNVAPEALAGRPEDLLKTWDRVKTLTSTPAEASIPLNGGRGYYNTGESNLDWVNRAMMDEGLAHLSERTLTPGGDPGLMNLANKLKVGTGMKPGSDPWAAAFDEWDKLLGQGQGAKQMTAPQPQGPAQGQGGLMDDVMEALKQLQASQSKGGY